MKDTEKGGSLFEISVFLIVLSIIIASFVQAQRTEVEYGNNFVIAQTIKKYAIALNRYLSDNRETLAEGVQRIPLETLIQSGVLGEGATASLGKNKIYFYARKGISNNIVFVSGLVTVQSSTISNGSVSYIEGLLGSLGGRKDDTNMIIKGNWGGWVLNLNEWPDAKNNKIFAYIPTINPNHTSTNSSLPEIDKLNLEMCESGSCLTFYANDNNNIVWSPLYTDDYLRIIPSGSSNITFYKVTIKYSGASYISNTIDGIYLDPSNFNIPTEGDIIVSIIPASSTMFGHEQTLTIHKKIPLNPLFRLWKSVEFRISSDDPNKKTGAKRFDCAKYQLLPSSNGKLDSVIFAPKTAFSKTLYDIELSFFGNNFLFKRNSFLALSYIYDSNHYPWFFINHPENSGYIDSCICKFCRSIKPGSRRIVPGAQLKVGNKLYDVSSKFHMTQWISSSTPTSIYAINQ